MTQFYKPLTMGVLMGPMMVWMVHGQLTGTARSPWAALAFVGVHLALVAVLIGGAFFAARLSPRMRHLLSRLHRPSVGHLGAMVMGLALAGLTIHFSVHGVG